MLDEDILLTMTGPISGVTFRDISDVLQIAAFPENENLISITTGPVAETEKRDILELMHTKMHIENEDRSNYWPIKGFI